MTDLLEKVSDWPQLVRQFLELVQNNILVGTPRDAWLALLIDESKPPENFRDLPCRKRKEVPHSQVNCSRVTVTELRNQINQRGKLAWVEKHVPDIAEENQRIYASLHEEPLQNYTTAMIAMMQTLRR